MVISDATSKIAAKKPIEARKIQRFDAEKQAFAASTMWA